MIKHAEFTCNLRGQEVTVRGEIEPADESVGILSPFMGNLELFDADGNVLQWDLTEQELDKLDAEFYDWLDSDHEGDFDYDSGGG